MNDIDILSAADPFPTMQHVTTDQKIGFARAIIALVRAELIAELHAYADAEYCRAIGLMQQPDCLGWEYKAQNGKFGEVEFKAHAAANKAFGAHFGIYAAIKEPTK